MWDKAPTTNSFTIRHSTAGNPIFGLATISWGYDVLKPREL